METIKKIKKGIHKLLKVTESTKVLKDCTQA